MVGTPGIPGNPGSHGIPGTVGQKGDKGITKYFIGAQTSRLIMSRMLRLFVCLCVCVCVRACVRARVYVTSAIFVIIDVFEIDFDLTV